MNIDIKCAVLRNCIPGGGVSWMLFCTHHPSGKIFPEFKVHHMAGWLLSLYVIMLSISTWNTAQMEEGSLGFTASSFKLYVIHACSLGKLSDWRRGTILKHNIKYTLIAQFQYFHIWFLYDKLNYACILSTFLWSIGREMHRRHYLQQNFSFSSCKTNRFHVTMGLYNNRSPNTSECNKNIRTHLAACTSCITCFYQGCRIFKFCNGTTTVWDWDF